ncbi:MAG: hypothetical protein IPN42_13215 [Methylococcaceae bacterium]|nr:hypothetical protein [Methylococcaceae bacterium]
MNNLPRRTVLKMLATAIAAGFAGVGISATQNVLVAATGAGFGKRFSYSTFASMMGETFTLVMVEPQRKYRVRMQLVEINSVFLSPENDQFNLVFKLANSITKPDGVYRVLHATRGSANLFLQPMGNELDGNYCIANFNLLT